jgi:hypothetical protein
VSPRVLDGSADKQIPDSLIAKPREKNRLSVALATMQGLLPFILVALLVPSAFGNQCALLPASFSLPSGCSLSADCFHLNCATRLPVVGPISLDMDLELCSEGQLSAELTLEAEGQTTQLSLEPGKATTLPFQVPVKGVSVSPTITLDKFDYAGGLSKDELEIGFSLKGCLSLICLPLYTFQPVRFSALYQLYVIGPFKATKSDIFWQVEEKIDFMNACTYATFNFNRWSSP